MSTLNINHPVPERTPAHSNSEAGEIIKALGGNTSTGMCKCPAHDDHTPSLSISDKAGKVLFHCHAGCSQDAVLNALRARGYLKRKPFVRDPELLSHKKEYRNLREEMRMARAANDDDGDDGRVLTRDEEDYRKLRRAWGILRAAVSSRSSGKLKDYFKGRGIDTVPESAEYLPAQSERKPSKWVARKLFNKGLSRFPAMVLPVIGDGKLRGCQVTFLSRTGRRNLRSQATGKNIRLTYAPIGGGYVQLGIPNRDHPLIVAEGVENALAASQLTGLPAIATLGTSNMAKSCNPPACSKIIIAADADDTGEKAAEALAERMSVPVRIALPPEGCKDWNEALLSDTNRHELKQYLLRAPKFERRTVAAIDLNQFVGLRFPKRQFLLKPWLKTGSTNTIDAYPGHCKTWLVLSIGYAIASGQDLLGWSVEQRGKVLYVDGELPGELLQNRLQKLGPALPDGAFSILSRSQFELRGEPMLDLDTQAARDYLDSEIERLGVDVVILDSLTTLFRSGEDNPVEDWRPVQDWFLKHQARGRAIIFLHHLGRSGNPRGTSAREIIVNARLTLKLDADLTTEDETVFKLEFTKARDFFGADAAPSVVFLTTRSGVAEWRREEVSTRDKELKEKIRGLQEQGLNQKQIATRLKLSPGRISQVRKVRKIGERQI